MKRLLFAAIPALALTGIASANITLDSPLTNEVHTFVPFFEGGLVAESSLQADPLGTFDVDFGTLGETEFTVTWQAPAGQLIEIAPPAGYDFYELYFRYRTEGINVAPGTVVDPFELSITDASGDTLPAPFSSLSFTSPGGEVVNAFLSYEVVGGETFRFSSLTGTGTVPAGYDVDFDQIAVRDFGIYGAAFTNDLNAIDPGPWVRLVPVPEPSSLALLALGGLLVARRRR